MSVSARRDVRRLSLRGSAFHAAIRTLPCSFFPLLSSHPPPPPDACRGNRRWFRVQTHPLQYISAQIVQRFINYATHSTSFLLLSHYPVFLFSLSTVLHPQTLPPQTSDVPVLKHIPHARGCGGKCRDSFFKKLCTSVFC
jgi:hypothetical protein